MFGGLKRGCGLEVLLLLCAAAAGGCSTLSHSMPRHVAQGHLPRVTRLARVDLAERAATRRQQHRERVLGSVSLVGQHHAATLASAGLPSVGTEVSHAAMRMLGDLGRLPGPTHNVASMPGRLRGGIAVLLQGAAVRTTQRLVQLKSIGPEYVGTIGVGTRNVSSSNASLASKVGAVPEAELNVIYDTGSSDLWVASDLCDNRTCLLGSRPYFNHSRSLTFQQEPSGDRLTTYYGSGAFRGVPGVDDVRLGTVVARGQRMGLVTKQRGALNALPIDGIVGLGFPSLATTTKKPLLDTLLQQRALQRSEFAFYLHKDPLKGGAIIWGGPADERLYEKPLVWFPLVEESYWALHIDGLRLGDVDVHIEPGSILIVDSGTTFQGFPERIYDAVEQWSQPGPCSDVHSLEPLVYRIRDVGGLARQIEMRPEDYMVRDAFVDAACRVGAMPIPSVKRPDGSAQDVFILGEVFMRHFLTVFHRGSVGQSRVGIARAVFDDEADGFFEGEGIPAGTAAEPGHSCGGAC